MIVSAWVPQPSNVFCPPGLKILASPFLPVRKTLIIPVLCAWLTITLSNLTVVTGSCDPDNSWTRQHCSLKLSSKLKYFNVLIPSYVTQVVSQKYFLARNIVSSPGKYLWQEIFKTPQALIFFPITPPPFQNLGRLILCLYLSESIWFSSNFECFVFMILTFYALVDKSTHWRCSIKKVVLKNFAKFTGEQLCQSLFFNKVAGLGLQFYEWKKKLWHRCFPLNFAKF